MKPVLVFGRQGQVARELAALASAEERPFLFLGHAEVDLGAGPDLARILDEAGAGGVINAAAYTAVDRAESEPEAALRLNRDAPAGMARACAERGIPFVHFSTDYVFDGEKAGPYLEDDVRNPQSVYGRSKAEGEDAVADAGGVHAILRTAWVFSGFGANFLKTMLRLAQTRPEIGVVADQHGRPTWARDAALAALASLDALERDRAALGVLHVAGAQDASWADFAGLIFAEQQRRGGPAAAVRPIGTADYPTPARRPRNSRLDTGRAQARLGWQASPLAAAISAVFDQLEQQTP
jgi:dTDP-4-dehydrorhamnose reductase